MFYVLYVPDVCRTMGPQTLGPQMVRENHYILYENFLAHLDIDDAGGAWYSGTIPRAVGSRGLPAGAFTSG